LPKRAAIAVVGDLHSNSTAGLMPPTFKTNAGNVLTQNPQQEFLWNAYTDYCAWLNDWNIEGIVINGDIVQGINAKDAQLLSVDESDQHRFALECLKPLVFLPSGKKRTPYIYLTRGTGFHSGKNGSREEIIAAQIGAVRDENGAYSRYVNWIQWRGKLLHFTHHIHHASVYPLSPLQRAQKEARERAQLGYLMPDVDIRSHVHTCHAIQGADGRWTATAPAWQLPTEFSYKVVPASLPSIGGLLICQDELEPQKLRVLRRLYSLPNPQPFQIGTIP
jgi:hypothetical protein